jgi:hypothetical protein
MRLTENQQAALACLGEAGQFSVPPEHQGQIVLVSYGCAPQYIYERRLDQSDRTVTITAYRHPADESAWEPWNSTPKRGRRVGVIFRGREWDEPGRTAVGIALDRAGGTL